MRILVVEDEKDLNRILVKTLEKSGYGVDACFDGEEAEDYLDSACYDAVILDVMLPKKDGYALLSERRRRGDNTPVLFLTARDSIADRVHGLDLGADDYLIKPFSFDELLARIRVITRTRNENKNGCIRIADLEMDTIRKTVQRAGKDIFLSAKEYSLLEYMLRNKGAVLSRESIENNLWNFDYSGGTNVVDVYISYLRKKIDGGFSGKLIHTVRGIGWVLREDGTKE